MKALAQSRAEASAAEEAEGTPGYLPPEVLRAGTSPGWAGDAWALGCVTFFCLKGRPKYYGDSFEEVCAWGSYVVDASSWRCLCYVAQVLFQIAKDYPSHGAKILGTADTVSSMQREVTFACDDSEDDSAVTFNETTADFINGLMHIGE